MIIVKISNLGKSIQICFPCQESELEWKLEKIGIYGKQNAPHCYLDEMEEPKALEEFKHAHVNLDELNYLAKRMEGFDKKERQQFFAAMKSERFHDMRGLINLTFNLAHYTLVQDVSDIAAVGKIHLLNIHGGLTEEELENKELLAVEGKTLLSSGRGIATEYGLVFHNATIPFQEVYKGEVFPDYDYKGTALVRAEIGYKGYKEIIYLPDDDLALQKSLARLRAEVFSECAISLERECMEHEGWLQHIQEILNSEGIYEANHVLSAFQDCVGQEWDKLTALAEYAGIERSSNLAKLARNFKQFEFIAGIETVEDVGHYFIDKTNEFHISPELEDFLDFGLFGTYLAEEKQGKFVSVGFIYYNGDGQVDNILDQLEHEEQSVTIVAGGM